MLAIRFFGGATIEGPSGILTGRATQRHRLALLAMLAVSGNGGMSRDKLLAYLWPEVDLERGRHLLSNSLYVLRSALGEHALPGTADTIRLDPGLLECDVREFEDAVRENEFERAVALYRGPFLDGFHISGLPEFERWVENERARLARLRDRALEALAESAEERGSHHEAVRWWKERAASDPLDSHVAMKLMRAMIMNGNRAGALRHGAVHQRMLNEEFGPIPDAEFARFLEQVREEPEAGEEASKPTGEAALPASRATPGDAPARQAASIVSSTSDAVPRTSRIRPGYWWAAALVAVVMASAASLTRNPEAPNVPPSRSIVVLPFVNMTADEENEYFADGLTAEIIARLAGVDDLTVVSRTSAMHYKGSTQSLRQIAAELGVAHAVEGSVQEGTGGLLHVTVQLVDALTDAPEWVQSFDVARDGSFGMQVAIAEAVVREAKGLGTRD